MPFNFSEDTVKAVSLAFNNIRDFILKPSAGWTFTIAMAIALYINGDIKYQNGLKQGKSNAKDQVASLERSLENDQKEIKTLNNRIYDYRKQLDTCNKSINPDMEIYINQRLDEAERLRKLIEKKLNGYVETNKNLKTVPR